MKVTHIPFVKYLGIKHDNEENLKLEKSEVLENHLQTLHAGALFTLAETQSGLHLQKEFPEYVGKVIPLLRDVKVTYKKPVSKSVIANATIDEESKITFSRQLNLKGRANIMVNITLKDEHDSLVLRGQFSWFIQMIGV